MLLFRCHINSSVNENDRLPDLTVYIIPYSTQPNKTADSEMLYLNMQTVFNLICTTLHTFLEQKPEHCIKPGLFDLFLSETTVDSQEINKYVFSME